VKTLALQRRLLRRSLANSALRAAKATRKRTCPTCGNPHNNQSAYCCTTCTPSRK